MYFDGTEYHKKTSPLKGDVFYLSNGFCPCITEIYDDEQSIRLDTTRYVHVFQVLSTLDLLP
jgi:hypothetical protein